MPPGTTIEVLINDQVAPGVRFEGLTLRELSLSRATSDLSWPGIFYSGEPPIFTNPPVTIRLSLPNGSVVSWNLRGGNAISSLPTYNHEFIRVVGSDGKPYDLVKLKYSGTVPPLTRTNYNLTAAGTLPKIFLSGRLSGQPPTSSMRLVVNNVNYNNVLFLGSIHPEFEPPSRFYVNPTHHPDLSRWVLGTPQVRSVQVVLVSGLPGTVVLGASRDFSNQGGYLSEYRVFPASDGLPVEEFSLLQTP